MGAQQRDLPGPCSQPALTLGLHSGPHQSQGVAGDLATGAGDGATGQEHGDPRVGRFLAVLLQPPVLEGLQEKGRVAAQGPGCRGLPGCSAAG